MPHIYWIEPYTADKKIGREYNNMVALMPDHSWIGITDHDMCFLHPEQKKRIGQIVQENDYDLYGCVTNRLRSIEQAPYRDMANEVDFVKHKKFAESVYEKHGKSVVKADGPIAGMMMVFNKDTWEKVGGFAKNRIDYDVLFSKAVGNNGIMQGIYVFHDYRQPYPIEEACDMVGHLIR